MCRAPLLTGEPVPVASRPSRRSITIRSLPGVLPVGQRRADRDLVVALAEGATTALFDIMMRQQGFHGPMDCLDILLLGDRNHCHRRSDRRKLLLCPDRAAEPEQKPHRSSGAFCTACDASHPGGTGPRPKSSNALRVASATSLVIRSSTLTI